MTDLSAFLAYGVLVFGLVFVVEAIYALFFRNFGLVKFEFAFNVPGADVKTVWATYFDGQNEWNSVTERLSYDVVSETPRVIRSTARLRGTDAPPVTMEWRLDMLTPGRACRSTVVKIDGVEVPAAERSSETFRVSQSGLGTDITVEASIPVRGWLHVPLHRRNLARIFEDLRMACLRQTGVPFEALERRWWFWTVKRS